MVVTPPALEISPENPNNIDITSVSEIHKTEKEKDLKTLIMEDFLNSYDRKSTSRMYKRGLDLFLEWYGKEIEAVLVERKDDLTIRPNENLVEAKQRAKRFEKLLEKFHSNLLQKGYKLNSARTYCLGILQLFRYHEMAITLRRGSPIVDTVISTGDFVLMPEHVKAMFHVAKDLRSKLLISMGNDLGWRISDVISIKRDELPMLEQKTPIEWIRITQKEKQVAKSCLSKTTVFLLKEYLFSVPTKNPYLFNHNGEGHIAEETVNARLRDLAKDASIELGFTKLHWHCFRKMIISTAKNLSIDPDIIKLLVGRAVKKDVLTYVFGGVDVRTAFNKLQGVLGITSLNEADEEEVKTLKDEVNRLNEQLEATRIVMMGLVGINRKQIETKVMKILGGRHQRLRTDTGGLTVERFVTKMSDKALCNFYVKMKRALKQPDLSVQHLEPEQVTQTRRR